MPLIGRAMHAALAVDRQEALGRAAHDRQLAELQVSGKRRRVGAAQAAVQRPGVGFGVGVDLVGQAHLIGLAGPQRALAAGDIGEVLLAPAPEAKDDGCVWGIRAVDGGLELGGGGAASASRTASSACSSHCSCLGLLALGERQHVGAPA